MAEQILIRQIEEFDVMRDCIELERRIWCYGETELVPETMFVVARKSGGQVIGAFDGSRVIGFALSFAGFKEGTNYLHSHMSHMVGVLAEYRDRGVGRLLKLSQREDALARGFSLIEWTFDPLQLKNANFNLARLGAIVRLYKPNLYGRTSSPLHAGLPTDRLVAEWWIGSSHVKAALAGNRATPHQQQTLVSIPTSIRQICEESPDEAERIQSQIREQFERSFAAGYAAVGFAIDNEKGSYVLEPYEN